MTVVQTCSLQIYYYASLAVDMGLTPDRVVTIAGDVRPLEESWAVLAS